MVEGANVDSVSMRIPISHEFRVRFSPPHAAKFGEPIEKQPIPTTNIENLPASPRTRKCAQGLDDEFCSRAPPPVLGVELAIYRAVGLVHKAFLDDEIVTLQLDASNSTSR